MDSHYGIACSLSRDRSETTLRPPCLQAAFQVVLFPRKIPPQWQWCIHKSPCNAIGANRTVFTVFLVFAARGQAFKCIVWTLRKEYTIWPWEKKIQYDQPQRATLSLAPPKKVSSDPIELSPRAQFLMYCLNLWEEIQYCPFLPHTGT